MTFADIEHKAKGYLLKRRITAANTAQIINAKFRRKPITSVSELTGRNEEQEDMNHGEPVDEAKAKADFERIRQKYGG